jgi:hypothetical protein
MNWKCLPELQQPKYDPRIGERGLNGKGSSDGGYTTLFAGEDPRIRTVTGKAGSKMGTRIKPHEFGLLTPRL